jgi:hypothetical protein
MDGDEVSLGEDSVDLDVHRPDGGEEVLDGLQSVAGLGVVLDVVLDDQLVEGIRVTGPEGVEEPGHRLLVALGRSHVVPPARFFERSLGRKVSIQFLGEFGSAVPPQKRRRAGLLRPFGGSGGGIRTRDLRVMRSRV